MSDNGAGRIHILGQTHRTVADLSSQQRSQLMDETLTTVHELLLQVAGMGQAILALKREQDELNRTCRQNSLRQDTELQRLDAFTKWQGDRLDKAASLTFWQRLRWIFGL